MNSKVLIIGAGVAGVAAAARLLEKGISDILILEAENRIGGRVYSVPFGTETIDIGGQWVHGEKDNVVFSMANPLGMLNPAIVTIDENIFCSSLGKEVNSAVAGKLLKILFDLEERSLKDFENFEGSVGEYFIDMYEKEVKKETPSADLSNLSKPIMRWFEKFKNSIDASDTWFATSGYGLTQYWDCEGNLLISWKKGGYSSVLDILMKKYPDPSKELPVKEKVLLNKEVTCIEWDNNVGNSRERVLVECADGSSYTSDYVIITASLGVLKEKAYSLFQPALPRDKLRAIKGLELGIVDKIFLKFPYEWWPKHRGFNFIWSKDEYTSFSWKSREGKDGRWLRDLFSFHPIDNVPNVLLGWIVGTSAKEMESWSDSDVLEGCMEIIRRFCGNLYDVPGAVEMTRSKWYMNPHFRGSYSFRSMDTELLNVSAAMLAEPVRNSSSKQVLFFGGEATHDHYYSTVHGAIESGWREAERVANLCRLGNEKSPPDSNEERNMKTCEVLIVGAGICGLAAAKTLCEQGIQDIILLEAQSQAGGRILSVPYGEGWLEIGAQWLHGQRNPVWQLAKEYNLLSEVDSFEGQGPFIRNDGVIFDPYLVEEVQNVVTNILQQCEEFSTESNSSKVVPHSVGEYLDAEFKKYMEKCVDDSLEIRRRKMELCDWHVRFEVVDNSCKMLNNLSAKSWGEFLSNDDVEKNLNFKSGYRSLIDVLVGCLPEDVLQLSTSVTSIKWSPYLQKENVTTVKNNSDEVFPSADYPVIVSCVDGSMFMARHVIVTCSLGYLKHNHKTMFCPQLPLSTTQAIEDMGFDTINKIFLSYEDPWWKIGTRGYQLIWSQNIVDDELPAWTRHMTGFDVLSTHRAVLLGWVGGEGAVMVEDVSEELVGLHCTHLLRKFLQTPDIPVPQRVIRSQWHNNEYVRGAYSNTSTLCDVSKCKPSSLAEPVYSTVENCKIQHPSILLAGEAAHSSQFSTTHGAFMSGQEQASVILAYKQQTSHA